MKRSSIFLILVVAIFSMSQIGSAERLYHWIDSQGVSQISQDPPSEGVQSVEVMEYSVSKKKPEGTAQDQSRVAPEKNKEQISGKELQKAEAQPQPEIDLATACYIKAGSRDVYVYVSEDRRPGGSANQNVLWKGDIMRGEKKLIKSSRGKIKFSYQHSIGGRSVGDNKGDCVNGKVITIE